MMSADVVAAVADVATPAPPWRVPDELLRSLAIRVNPFIAVRSSPAPANLRATGWLADVVDKHGWDEALDKYPEARAILRRLRNTVEELAAGAETA